MSLLRHIFALSVGAALISGCAGSGFPEGTASFSPQTRNAPWPGFLPIDAILSDDLIDFERSLAETRNLEARARHLRWRARLLKGPVLEIQERLRMQQAVDRRSP